MKVNGQKIATETMNFACVLVIALASLFFEKSDARRHRVPHDASQYRIAVEVHADADVDALAAELGMDNMGQVGDLKHHYVFQSVPKSRRRRDVSEATHNATLSAHRHVRWHQRQQARHNVKRAYRVADPEFGGQWHFADLNVQSVWDSGVLGDGVVVSIVDDGLQMTHPDLQAHFEADLSYDFNDDDPDVTPLNTIDDHGTSAAGACCAVNNMATEGVQSQGAFCGVGVAPNAHLSAVRLISRNTEDYQEVGVGYKADAGNDVYSNSWGPPDDGMRLEGPGPLAFKARERAMELGRRGLGVIYVWAAGNGRPRGDNCNYDGWANHRYALTIGAVGSDLKQPYYSENCASMFGVAPSNGHGGGITTTDLLGKWGTASSDCTTRFGGTSAAAPLGAGVVALVLSANRNLGWRDVQGIFALSSVPNDASDSSWVTTGSGLRYSHKYGFGLINAERAVKLARDWKNYAGIDTIDSGVREVKKDFSEGLSVYAVFTCPPTKKRVLHADLTMYVAHPRRGELQIQLKSPSGTVSELQEFHGDTHADIGNWTYSSVVNWHEAPAGEWQVLLVNQPKSTGTWITYQLVLHVVD
jgi:subtilisin family serine protease